VINHDDIRQRIKARFSEMALPPTGKWLKESGIGQTTIRNFLDGSSSSLTVETVSKLAEPLKTTEQWILFGNKPGVSEDVLREMAEQAVSEIQPGMKIGEIRNAVSAALHEQLRHSQVVDGVQGRPEKASAPGTTARSRPSTSGAERVISHNS
jgi:hypothetical protein